MSIVFQLLIHGVLDFATANGIFRESHPYMTPEAEGKSYMSTHQEILEEKHARVDHR